MQKQNENIISNTIDWLHSNTSIPMFTEKESMGGERERERERERGGGEKKKGLN